MAKRTNNDLQNTTEKLKIKLQETHQKSGVNPGDTDEHCTAQQDLSDAQKVADKLGIKLHTVNFSSDYWDDVFEHFLRIQCAVLNGDARHLLFQNDKKKFCFRFPIL
jgi:tRNA U34 2-thiouridine synthase MnmA/TrmU